VGRFSRLYIGPTTSQKRQATKLNAWEDPEGKIYPLYPGGVCWTFAGVEFFRVLSTFLPGWICRVLLIFAHILSRNLNGIAEFLCKRKY
jgi:hypothetical protein